MNLNVTGRDIDTHTVIELVGRLDGLTMEHFVSESRRLMGDATGSYVIDFSGVPYISSAGLRGILMLAKETQQHGGRFVLCAPDKMVKEVFDLARLSSVIPVHDTVEEAVQQS